LLRLLRIHELDAIKALAGMDRTIARRIRAKILALAQDPRIPNNNVKKLTGIEGCRLRVGDWRVVCTLKHEILTVIVIRGGHRREIYE
jgi:mRNA interferase RelE/StbE